MNKAFSKVKVNFDQTLRKTINHYNIIYISYKNIYYDASNIIDFVLCMLMIYSKNLVKLYIF
jgi:hypothetical protein